MFGFVFFFSYFIKKRKRLTTFNAFNSKSRLWIVVHGQKWSNFHVLSLSKYQSWFAVWESHGSSTDFSLFTVGGEVGEQGGGSYKCLYHLPLLQGAANFTHIYFKVQFVGNLLLLGFILEYNFYFLLNKHGIIKKKGGWKRHQKVTCPISQPQSRINST